MQLLLVGGVRPVIISTNPSSSGELLEGAIKVDKQERKEVLEALKWARENGFRGSVEFYEEKLSYEAWRQRQKKKQKELREREREEREDY
jgi:hypothetical protein